MLLLTPKEVAVRLRVSPRTVYSWIETGRLSSVRLSERVTRVPQEAVEALMRDALVASEDASRYGRPAVVGPETSRAVSEGVCAQLVLHREEIVCIAAHSRVGNVRVFGSVARGSARDDSDVDLLVDALPGASLFDLSRLATRLEEMLARKVDVVVASALKPGIRDAVLRDARPL